MPNNLTPQDLGSIIGTESEVRVGIDRLRGNVFITPQSGNYIINTSYQIDTRSIQNTYNQLVHDSMIYGESNLKVYVDNNTIETNLNKGLKKRKETPIMNINNNELIIKLPKMSKLQKYLVTKNGPKDLVMLSDYLTSFSRRNAKNGRDFKIAYDIRPYQYDVLATKQSNSVYKKAMQQFDPSESHKPGISDHGKWIGVEIECFIPKWRLRELNLSSEDERELSDWLLTKKIKGLSLKDDGSIHCDEEFMSAEFTLVFNQKDRTPLVKLCAVLKELKAQVNKSCGLHVHFDQRDLFDATDYFFGKKELMQRARNVGRCLGFLSQVVPYSRRNNTFCALKVGRLTGKRYNAVNLCSVKKFKTIEIRMHSSTIEFEKINNWIDLLLIIMYTKNNKKVNNLSDLCDTFNIPEKLISFYEARIEKFKENETQEIDSGMEQQHFILSA